MRRELAVLVALAAGIASPTASAGSTFATAPPAVGPVLAGPNVLWAVPRWDGGFAIRQASAGASPSTVARFSPPPAMVSLIPALAASPDRLAVSEQAGDSQSFSVFRSVFTAPSGGGFETLDKDCDLAGTPDFPRPVDVSGQAVVFPRCDSHGNHNVVVRDYSTPTPVDQVVAPGPGIHGLRLAGRYVAWQEGGAPQAFSAAGIAVYDRVLGKIAYRIPQSSMPGPVNEFDLQDDGKVVFSLGTRTRQVAWASPSEPRAHRLDLPPRTNYEVRLVGDRIGFEAGVDHLPGDPISADVGVSDLAGHWRRLGNFAEGIAGRDDFDFDGTRIAWWSYGCTRAFVHVINAGGPPALSRPRSGCRLRFTAKPSLADAAVRLHIDCFGFQDGMCFARHIKLVFGRVVVAKGNSARHVTLTTAGRRLLRRHRVLRVRAVATLRDGSGRRERRSGALTLRR